MGNEENADRLHDPMERSDDPRLPVDEEATLVLFNSGEHLRCRIVEISLGGCRVKLPGSLPAGAGKRVEAAFKLRGIAFRFNGDAEWVSDEHLVGIQFVGATARGGQELVGVLCEIAAANAIAQVKRAAARRAAQEAEAGAAAPQAAPQDKLAAAPAPPRAVRGRERRNQSRHEVDTSATILLINIASRITGRILNLSLGGCRIRTQERFPVGIYTRVETEFHLEGLPFRLAGVIQAVQDRQFVGIRFLDVSERKREQLQLLIAEIEEMSESGAAASAG
jgi:c-di-GMP-binding flagellar brake protein YcgR